ncbi:MAG: hypothetical protein AB1546_04875 [bacterium]
MTGLTGLMGCHPRPISMMEPELFREKIKNAADLASLAEGWRKEGKKIVFTADWFDPLHVSHIRHLEKSRTLGDVLIAGIFSENALSDKTAEPPPLIDEDGRSMIVAAVECVDFVVTVAISKLDILFSSLKPDIYATGQRNKGTVNNETLEELAAIKAASCGSNLIYTNVEILTHRELAGMIASRMRP